MGRVVQFGVRGGGLPLAVNLLNAALANVLTRRWNYLLDRPKPLVFVSRLPGRDLVEIAAKGRSATAGLHVYPEYRLDVRRNGPAGHPGVIVGLKARYEIDLSVAELIRLGMDLRGQYVLAESEGVRWWPSQAPSARRKFGWPSRRGERRSARGAWFGQQGRA